MTNCRYPIVVLFAATRATAGCPNLQDLKANHPPPMGLFGRRCNFLYDFCAYL